MAGRTCCSAQLPGTTSVTVNAMRVRQLAVLGLTTALVSCGTAPPDASRKDSTQPAPGAAVDVRVIAEDLDHPWDIDFLPDGAALVTERSGELSLLPAPRQDAGRQPVDANFDDLFAQSEAGLMGLLVHPDFADNRRFVTCQATQDAGEPRDVRLITWQLSPDRTRAERVGEPLLTGIPLRSGRHAGCRLGLDASGALLVTTGDSANPAVPQDRSSLGGKVLRLDPDTGQPPSDNPLAEAPNTREKLTYTYGHRNAQGLAPRADGQVFIAEHGPDFDDEINLLRAGRNYGWAPYRENAPDEYDETVPMTDLGRFPDAVPAVWSSGDDTEAVSDATFLSGRHWGTLDGALAVTALKGSKLLLFELGADGDVHSVAVPPELDDTRGRLRAARQGPDGALYVTTSNGGDDQILRVTPNDSA